MVKLRYCFGAFLLLSLIVVPMRGGYWDLGPFEGFCMSSFAGAIISYFLLWYFLSKRNEIKILLVAMAGMFLFTLPLHIFSFESTRVSLLEFFIHLIALCCSFIVYRYSKKEWRYAITVFLLAGFYWISVPGYHFWIHYLNHDTFTGRIEERKVTDTYVLQTLDGDTFCLTDWKGKRVLLDIWSKNCGICWKALPRMQSLYEQYNNSSDVVIATAFAPYEKNEWESVKDEVQKTYSFPVYLIDPKGAIFQDLKIDAFPVYVVLNEKSELIYRGNLDGAEKLLKSLK